MKQALTGKPEIAIEDVVSDAEGVLNMLCLVLLLDRFAHEHWEWKLGIHHF